MSNMFKPTTATSVDEYLAAVPKERRDIIAFLHNFIPSVAPELTPHFASNMLGYGSFRYRNYKKEVIDWPIVALANQKQYISLYICALEQGEYLAEKYSDELGTVSVGKSCIRFKKLEEVNLSELKKILRKAARWPGLAP
jgi:uncharacterized protein YdhG (YjbR/CyaY superfamily)